MKQIEHEKHIQQLQSIFFRDQRHEKIQNMQTFIGLYDNQEVRIQEIKIKDDPQIKESQMIQESIKQITPHLEKYDQMKLNKKVKKYKFELLQYLLQVIVAYAMTIAFFYLTTAVNIPFFEIIIILAMATLFQGFYLYFFIILGLPIIITNYILSTQLLGWLSIVICYISIYSIAQNHKIRILWILDAILLLIYGLFLIPLIYGAFESDKKFIFFFVFPFVNGVVKLLSVTLKHFIKKSSIFLLEFGFFVLGIQYGVLTKISTNSIQFWFVMVMLTLDILNNNYKAIWRGLSYLCEIPFGIFQKQPQKYQKQSTTNQIFISQDYNFNQQFSGFMCLHSFHMVGLVYLLLVLKLGTYFNSNIIKNSLSSIESPYSPFIIYCFFSGYQLLSLIKLRKRQDIFIIGNHKSNWLKAFGRGMTHSLGFWLFYLGLSIPISVLN